MECRPCGLQQNRDRLPKGTRWAGPQAQHPRQPSGILGWTTCLLRNPRHPCRKSGPATCCTGIFRGRKGLELLIFDALALSCERPYALMRQFYDKLSTPVPWLVIYGGRGTQDALAGASFSVSLTLSPRLNNPQNLKKKGPLHTTLPL